ncbi:MAG: carboxylesterase family protein [Burkholderiales bacterium]|nr:carboxylesterase family protein [Burkholderiales bacterium]
MPPPPNPKRRLLLAATATLPVWVAPFGVAPSARAQSHTAAPITQTRLARYEGLKVSAVSAFLGIRYGADTATTRFQPPRAFLPTEANVRAQQHGAISPQRNRTSEPQSEDCLFLNIWTPDADARAKRPVMVYIHGGAYATGSGNDPVTQGAPLAARGDVVVVTVTHRLNALGYLYLGRIDPRFPDSGNAGQLDLILALQWVRDHVAAFGGDAHNITVFGQSGGGAKIATLLGTPAAKGLFHKAITMSGQQVTASGPQNATARARAFLAKLGKDPAIATQQELVAALDAVDPILGGGVYFGPVLDGRTLTRHPFYPDAHPQGLSVPLLLGNTISETRAFFPPAHAKLQGLTWDNLAERLGPELRVDISPELVVARYREWFREYSPEQVFIAATTAGRSWRGQLIEAEERAKAGAPAWVYQLNFENAMHTADIGLAFGTVPSPTAAQKAMSERLMDVFLRFTKNGDPGWPAYVLPERKTMVFDVESRVVDNPRGRERELFATVPYIQPGT